MEFRCMDLATVISDSVVPSAGGFDPNMSGICRHGPTKSTSMQAMHIARSLCSSGTRMWRSMCRLHSQFAPICRLALILRGGAAAVRAEWTSSPCVLARGWLQRGCRSNRIGSSSDKFARTERAPSWQRASCCTIVTAGVVSAAELERAHLHSVYSPSAALYCGPRRCRVRHSIPHPRISARLGALEL